MTITPGALAQHANEDERTIGASVAGLDRQNRACVIPPPQIVIMMSSRLKLEGQQLPLSQIRKDLNYLEAAADNLSNTASQSDELDLRAIAKSASEIRRRARLLKHSLKLSNTEKHTYLNETDLLADEAKLRAALSDLALQINCTISNPILKGYLLDARGSAKAQSDLDEIIELSRRIELSSEMIGKARK